MPKLGTNKNIFLSQVKKRPDLTIKEIRKFLDNYEDLTIDDLRGNVSEQIIDELLNGPVDPKEQQTWADIQSLPRTTVGEVSALIDKVNQFAKQYPASKKAGEAQNLYVELQHLKLKLESVEKERLEWERLEKGNYMALQTYKAKYPNSVHLDEIDDYMWKNTLTVMGSHALTRYLGDWPLGRHAAEARKALEGLAEWEEVKRSGDLFLVDDYRDNHPDSPFITEVNALYFKLRDAELEAMKANPSLYDRDEVTQYLNADIFTKWQLIDEGLMTEESWEKLQIDRNLFPNIQDYQVANPDLAANPDCTDIYLFGTPGTGKTCLLMGLAGADGNGYTLNMRTQGGPYASALQQYVNAGITPGRTFGSFVTTINGLINDNHKGHLVTHPINLVEMSGEEFALHIAENQKVSLADMGTGATNLLRNGNRKVFFIIVDSTKESVKFNYTEQVRDTEGNIIEDRLRKRYISQLDILNKFVGLFSLPENQDIMRNVDAIHFVVTKADMLGEESVRKQKARELLLSKYLGPVQNLKTYCQQTKRINAMTRYSPQVFTFSLGRFYLGDVFDFEKNETLDIIEAIRAITIGRREDTWWDKFKGVFGG